MPANLTPLAEADMIEVLARSLAFGTAVSRATRGKLIAYFARIERGVALGHKHSSIAHRDDVRCVSEPPLVIFYDQRTRLVLRIVDGRRDLRDLLPRV